MSWIYIAIAFYFIILVLVCLRIIFETYSSTKAWAYLFFCIFIPVIGILFYLAFGINYWQKKLYTKKSGEDDKMLEELKKDITKYKESIVDVKSMPEDEENELAAMLLKDLQSPLTRHNRVKLLLNGEEKFPELMQCLSEAKHHIHMQYYIYEQDEIGTAIIELLIKKATEGIQVRFIYDDFGSPSIKKKIEKRMMDAGIEIYPFSKVHFYLLANRINYRNHRKIVVIDGHIGYTGSQNIVTNNYHRKDSLYYEELVARLEGPVVWQLSAVFRTDWYAETKNFLSSDLLPKAAGSVMSQVLPSGPGYRESSNLKLYTALMHSARKKIVIVTPYFVPDDALMTAITSAAQRGVEVTIINSEIIDKVLVGHAQRSYYEELLLSGVRIFLYKKPVFLHTKHVTVDDNIAVVGSSNFDIRSFELDLEVSLVMYDKKSVADLRAIEKRYIETSNQINLKTWLERPLRLKSLDSVARLTAALQ